MRRVLRAALEAPVVGAMLRPFVPGWPDEGRGIVQGPMLAGLLGRIVWSESGHRTVLNAGAGEGLYTQLLVRETRPSRLLEIDPSFGKRARPALAGVRRLSAAGSLTSLPFAARSADLIFCTEVLEHVPDDDAAVSEMRRVLAPGGWLLLSVPTPPAVFDRAHVREGYTLDALAALFARHRLRVVGSDCCMHFFFKAILRWWRPGLVPGGAIRGLSRLDRVLRLGRPMDLAVLARAV